MTKVLTAENAVIKTAAVTIRTLTIEGRQVTMAVFRQLLERDIVDSKTLTLRGVGWGHVRYLVDGNADEQINLLWQDGSDLRRCIVNKTTRVYEYDYQQAIAKPVATANGKSALPADLQHAWPNIEDGYVAVVHYQLNRGLCVDPVLPLVHIMERSIRFSPEGQRKANIKLEEYQERVRARIRLQLALDKQWHARRNALVRPLFDLPQLFIAT